MCGCMPFFPALVKNTNLVSATRSMGSRIMHPHRSSHRSANTSRGARNTDPYQPPRSKEHYVELGMAPSLGGIQSQKKLSVHSSSRGSDSISNKAVNPHTWEDVDPETYMKKYGRT
ncbi:MAG: hypothetical protein Q9190_002343 [Brigantiaea leucoxantha]